MNAPKLLLSVITAGALAFACGGGDSEICENGVSVTIVDNHPDGSHELEVPIGDIEDAVEETYDIQGRNVGHGHTVTVTAADFTALADGSEVTIESSDTGAVGMDHTHDVILLCN